MVSPSFRDHVMAVDRVERRLKLVSSALDAAGIPYAVVGGNAVAAWVARVDPAATRATKDVDLLVRRADVDRISGVLESLGFTKQNLRDLVLFLDPEEPSKRSGIHLVWADEKVRPSYLVPTPSVDEVTPDVGGFRVLAIGALVRMKLTSFRDIDRVHVADLISVGLIDEAVRASLPAELRTRLEEIEQGMEEDF
jgi:hypothetical protein